MVKITLEITFAIYWNHTVKLLHEYYYHLYTECLCIHLTMCHWILLTVALILMLHCCALHWMFWNTNTTSLPYANEVLHRLAYAPCKTQAFMSLSERRIAGQLNWQSKLLAHIPYLEQRSDPVWSGWIFPHKQECSRTVSWWLCHLPNPVCHIGTWNEITWHNY